MTGEGEELAAILPFGVPEALCEREGTKLHPFAGQKIEMKGRARLTTARGTLNGQKWVVSAAALPNRPTTSYGG